MLFGATEFQQYVITEMAKHSRKKKWENCSKIVRRDVSFKLWVSTSILSESLQCFPPEQLWL